MKKKNRGKFYLGIFVVSAILIGIFILNPSTNTNASSYTFDGTFSLTPLSILEQSYITCYAKTQVDAYTATGKRIVGQSQFFTDNPVITYDLTTTSDGTKVEYYEVTPKVRCDTNNDGYRSVGFVGFSVKPSTSLALVVETTNLKGDVIHFAPIIKNPIKITLVDNEEVELVKYKIQASDLEKNYEATVTPYKREVNFIVGGAIKFEYGTGSSPIQYDLPLTGSIPNKVYIMVNKIIPPTTQPATTKTKIVSIEELTQTVSGKDITSPTNPIDSSVNNGRQIKAIGLLRDWSNTEGNPTFTIYQDNRLIGTVIGTFDGFQTGTDQDGLFKGLYTIPLNSPAGLYQVKMKIATRDMVSTETFYVKTSAPPPTGTTPITPISFEQPTGATNAKVRIHFKHVFQDYPDCSLSTGECVLRTLTVASQVKDLGFIGVALTPALLTSPEQKSGQTVVAELTDITLTPQVFFDTEAQTASYSRAISSDLTFKTTLLANGKTIPLPDKKAIGLTTDPVLCFNIDGKYNCPSLIGGITLGQVKISAFEIEDALKKGGVEINSKVEIKSIASGQFELRDTAGKTFVGKTQGVEYNWSVTYGGSAGGGGAGGTGGILPDKCQTTNKDIPCTCDEGFILKFDDETQQVQCFDPVTGEKGGASEQPEQDCGFLGIGCILKEETVVEPYCVVDGNGNIIATYGEITSSSPNCQALNSPSGGTGNGGSGVDANGDPEEEPVGNVGNAVVCDSSLIPCVNALSDLLDEQDNQEDLTTYGIVIGIIIIIIAIIIYVAKRNKPRGY